MKSSQTPPPDLPDISHPAHTPMALKPWLCRATIFVMSLAILWIDYLTGPTILFPLWFAVPVVITGWYDGFLAACGYAILLPFARFGMRFLWPPVPVPLSHWLVNIVIRVVALGLVGYLAARNGRLTREIRVLQGLLPICMYCHRLRTEKGNWVRLEAYMEQHSEASFTHGICPYCLPKAKVRGE